MRHFEEYIVKGPKALKYGYTTGTCATAAAKASAQMLFSQTKIEIIEIMTSKGFLVPLRVTLQNMAEASVTCSITKDAGDDPDVTHGIQIYATLSKTHHNGIRIEGGRGIGRVTKPGLKVAVGEAAINPSPRKTILEEVEKVCQQYGYDGGLEILIEAPEGVEIAKKTFNERLGIVDGISILGTSGIVEPMSEAAIIETIYTEMNMLKTQGVKELVVCPGNYGMRFIEEHTEKNLKEVIKCSNFIGETLDYAVHLGFEKLVMVGHVGKFIKLAAGIMNTHSKYADGRIEIFCAHAARVGAPKEVIDALWQSITTDEALGILKEEGLLEPTLKSVMGKIQEHVNYRVREKIPVQVIMFSDRYGLLSNGEETEEVLTKIKEVDKG